MLLAFVLMSCKKFDIANKPLDPNDRKYWFFLMCVLKGASLAVFCEISTYHVSLLLHGVSSTKVPHWTILLQFLFPILSLVSRLRNTVAQYGAELGNNNSIALWFALCYCLMFSKSWASAKYHLIFFWLIFSPRLEIDLFSRSLKCVVLFDCS